MTKKSTTAVLEPVTQFDDDFAEVDFAEEGSEKDSLSDIPFAQQVTVDIGLTRWDDAPTEDRPVGIFIQKDQADKAGFVPDDNWVIEYPVLGGVVRKFDVNRGTEGYMLKPGSYARMIVLYKSSKEVFREVERNGKKYKECQGYYYSGYDKEKQQAIKSEAGIQADEPGASLNGWQVSTRYLVYFLNQQNQPLHSVPISIRISSAFDIGFSVAINENFREMQAAFSSHAQSKGVYGKTLNYKKDASRVVLQFSQGMRTSSAGQGTTFVNARAVPSWWDAKKGQAKPGVIEIKNKHYVVEGHPVPYTSLLILNNAPMFERIQSDLETYARYRIPANLRRTVVEDAPNAVSENQSNGEWFVYEEDAPMGLAGDALFVSCKEYYDKADSIEKVEKWLAWMQEAKRMDVLSKYPDYLDTITTMASAKIAQLSDGQNNAFDGDAIPF